MATSKEIRNFLQSRDREHALPLFDAMIARAQEDDDYDDVFDTWLREGSTLRLRDELAEPLHDKVDFSDQGRKYPFADAWMAIDTARLYIETMNQDDARLIEKASELRDNLRRAHRSAQSGIHMLVDAMADLVPSRIETSRFDIAKAADGLEEAAAYLRRLEAELSPSEDSEE